MFSVILNVNLSNFTLNTSYVVYAVDKTENGTNFLMVDNTGSFQWVDMSYVVFAN